MSEIASGIVRAIVDEVRVRRGRVDCGFRVVDGSEPGLRSTWRGGTARLSEGQIRFTSLIGGARFLRRRAVTITVARLEAAPATKTGWASAGSLAPDMPIVRVHTPVAVLEWAVPAGLVDQAMAQVALGS